MNVSEWNYSGLKNYGTVVRWLTAIIGWCTMYYFVKGCVAIYILMMQILWQEGYNLYDVYQSPEEVIEKIKNGEK
jgi:hypothetical protein